jgi:AraC family transcriptional activator of pobA
MLVDLLRLMRRQDVTPTTGGGPQAVLVARFREALERRYRTGATLEDYAAELGVTVSRLRDACLRVAGAPPIRLIHDRVVLEARRALLYSNMTISEVAFHLGFSDPAYFSRFFSKALGRSPRAFREAQGGD